jgi:hypothetical protein
MGTFADNRQLQKSTIPDHANVSHCGLAVIGVVKAIRFVLVAEDCQAFIMGGSLEPVDGNVRNEIAFHIN